MYDTANEEYASHIELYPDGLAGCTCGHCRRKLAAAVREAEARVDWLLDRALGLTQQMEALVEGVKDGTS